MASRPSRFAILCRLLAVPLLAGFALIPAPLSGQSMGEAALSSLEKERAALASARQAAEVARQRSEALEAEAQSAAEAVARVRAERRALETRITQAEAELRAAQARAAITARLQAAQALALGREREPVAQLTAALTQMARQPPVAALAQPGSVRDAIHLRILMGGIVPNIEKRTSRLRTALNRSRALARDAETSAEALATARQDLANRRSALAQNEARQRVTAIGLRGTAAEQATRALALAEEARVIIERLETIADSDSVRARLLTLPPLPQSALTAASSNGTEADSDTVYRLPVAGAVVTGFGERNDSGIHARGITLAPEAGAAVVAPSAGTVAYAGSYRSYGSVVIIDHGGGWTTTITGLADIRVDRGDAVGAGDAVGTAQQDRPRVTVELRRNGQPMDIAALMD